MHHEWGCAGQLERTYRKKHNSHDDDEDDHQTRRASTRFTLVLARLRQLVRSLARVHRNICNVGLDVVYRL